MRISRFEKKPEVDIKLVDKLVPWWLQRFPVLPFDNSLCYKFKMLPRSLRRSLIGPLDLNSKAAQQSIVGKIAQKQPITDRESRIPPCDWLSGCCWSLTTVLTGNIVTVGFKNSR